MNMQHLCDGAATLRRRLDHRARDELRAIAPEIVKSFLGEPNRKLCTRRQWRWGRKGSFAVNVAGDKQGLWYDHETQIGGDILQVQLGCSIADAITYALGFLAPAWPPRGTAAPSRTVEVEPNDAVRVDQALYIWSGVLPLRGSLAEQYPAVVGSLGETCGVRS
jgi:putative DNA primase/helicase